MGRTLTRNLYDEHSVAVLDTLRSGALRFNAGDHERFAMYQIDVRDYAAVQSAVDVFKPEAIIHLAAIHFIPECNEKPDEAIAINTLGTANMLRACPEGTTFVLASTAAVYSAEETPHREDSSPTHPMDVYGLTKLHAEHYVRLWAPMKSLDARIVRLFNVIGPGETNPHILPAILAQTMRGVSKLRLGNCHPKRDYIHVQDAASGFAAVATKPWNGPGVDVVNLGTGQSYSVYELVEQLGQVAGHPLEIETDPSRLRASDRPFVTASIDKIYSRYKWKPRFSLRESLHDLWQTPDIPAELLERS